MADGKLYFYTAGTTTPITVYQDDDATTPHATPVVADSAGLFAPIYLTDAAFPFKFILKTSADVTVQTVDDIQLTRVGVGSITTDRLAAKAVTEPKLADALTLSLATISTSRTVLKAVDTTRWNVAYLTEAGREGIFAWKTGNYSAHVTLDTLEGRYVKATAIAASVGCWVRQDAGLENVKWYGALGDSTTNDKAAFDAAFAVAKAYGKGLYFPTGIYSIDVGASAWTWDFTTALYGFTIEGDGLNESELRITNINTGAGQAGWTWQCTGAQYDKSIKGWMIRTEHNGPSFVLGQNDYSDSFETSLFERFCVINQKSGTTESEALRLNFVLGCKFDTVRVGCYSNGGGTNYGTAIRYRQACFNTFVNFDYGNGEFGKRYTDAGSYGNTSNGGGSENCHWNVAVDTSLATRNSEKGGRIALWTQYAITAGNGDTESSTTFEDIAFNNGAGPSTVLDPTNHTGVTIKDGRSVTTPSVPATTVAATNTTGKNLAVRIFGGAYTVVNVNGLGMSRASTGDVCEVTLPPSQTISVTYSSPPSWSWLAPNF